MRKRALQLTTLTAVTTCALGLTVAVANASVTPSTISVTVPAGTSAAVPGVVSVSVPAVPTKADIEIAIDTTGSMADAISQAQTEAINLVNTLKSQITDVEFSVVDFKDSDCDEPNQYVVRQTLTADATLVSTAIDAMSADGGCDAPEDYNLAFHNSSVPSTGGDLGWRADSRKFVVVIGDAEPHGAGTAGISGCSDTSVDPEGLNTSTVLGEMKTAGRSLFMLLAHPDDASTTLGCYQGLAAGAYPGGEGVDLGDDIATQLTSLVSTASSTVNNVHLAVTSAAPSPASASWLSFSPNAAGPISTPATVTFTTTVTVPAATAPGTYTFDLEGLADGGDVGHQTLTVIVPTKATPTPTPTVKPTVTPTPTVKPSPTPTVKPTPVVTPTPAPAGGPTVDKIISVDKGKASIAVTTPTRLTTSGGNELLVAYIQADGPTAPTQTVVNVAGGGLVWKLAARSNATWGTTEVWTTYVTSPVSVFVTAQFAQAFDSSMTVVAYKNAAHNVGAVATSSGISGSPSVTVTPTKGKSLVWASAHDWLNNVTPVPAAGQTIVHNFNDSRVHDDFWVQSTTGPAVAGPSVTLSATPPTGDRWTMAAVEIPAA